jgi:hypothetical protein
VPYFPDITTVGVKMDRNFNAPLSPSEPASLRGLGADSKREISSSHRQLLLSMGLVIANGNELILTEMGRRRLDHEDGTSFIGRGHESAQPPTADVWVSWR